MLATDLARADDPGQPWDPEDLRGSQRVGHLIGPLLKGFVEVLHNLCRTGATCCTPRTPN
jgi:hypothetical protein